MSKEMGSLRSLVEVKENYSVVLTFIWLKTNHMICYNSSDHTTQ